MTDAIYLGMAASPEACDGPVWAEQTAEDVQSQRSASLRFGERVSACGLRVEGEW